MVAGRGRVIFLRWGRLLAGYPCPSRRAHTHVLCALLFRCSGSFKKRLEIERELCWGQEKGWSHGVRVDIVKIVAEDLPAA